MGKQMIISLGREFGSGGHVIAEQLAKEFDLPLYDHNLLDKIAEEKGVAAGQFGKFDEKPGLKLFSRRVGEHTNSMEEHVAQLQFEYLKKKAESGESFVVVGRCSETILKEFEGLVSIFVLADRDAKIARVMKKYNLDGNDAIAKMNRHDKYRKNYHNKYAKYRWGDSRSYDLSINSSRLGIEGTAKVLVDYIRFATSK